MNKNASSHRLLNSQNCGYEGVQDYPVFTSRASKIPYEEIQGGMNTDQM